MPRKSKVGNKVLKKIESFFDLDTEVMMIIILIVFAILLICFLNKTKKRESFYRGVETTPSSTIKTCKELDYDLTKPQVHIFYADWCVHSRTFLNGEKKKLEEATNDKCSLRNRIILYNVEKNNGETLAGKDIKDDSVPNKEIAVTYSKVTKLPSFYQYFPDNVVGKQYIEFNSGETSHNDIITFLDKTKSMGS